MEQGHEILHQEKKKAIYDIFLGFIYTITVLIIGFTGYFNQQPISDVLKYILLMVIIITILFYVMKLYRIPIFQDQYSIIVFSISYFISLMGIMFSTNYEVYNLWMIGSVLVAVLIYPYFGLVFHFIFTFLFCAVNNPGMEYFAFYFIIGTILCMLAKFIVNPSTVIYIILIALSSNITLIFILHNFNYSDSIQLNSLLSVLSTLLVIGIAFFSQKFQSKESIFTIKGVAFDIVDQIAQVEDEEQEARAKLEALKIEDAAAIETPVVKEIVSPERVKLAEIMNSEYELLTRLSNYSKTLYVHSVDVSELSSRAAKLIGCDEEIARAGGMYHEIGRVVGKKYIEEGIQLLTEQRFPAAVIDIIKQHNSKVEKPKSMEAAIVMLTDSILSTMEYMAKMPDKKNITTGQLVENIFQIRLTKGTLDEAGISTQDFKKLKEFYINNCF